MAEILAAESVDFDIETQCVIVGAGACGLVAALRLAEAGIDSVVLERDALARGSSTMSSGFIPAAGTRQQQAQSIRDSAEEFASDIQRKAHNEANPDIVNAVTNQVGVALDWLAESHGFRWQVLDDFLYPGHSHHRMHTVPGKTGEALQSALLSACSGAGVDVVTQARVDALFVQHHDAENGSVQTQPGGTTVCGVRVSRPDGAFETIHASAIILACNGYAANTELMQRYIPEMANAHYHGHAGNTGDAVLWGESLGVPSLHMGAYQGHGSLAAGHHILITWALMMSGGVQLNQHGLRFSNELQGYSEQAVNVMAQAGSIAWNIYDLRLHELGMSFPDYQQAYSAGAVKQASDMAELARITDLPAPALTDTLHAIDTLAENNSTDNFGRTFNTEHRLKAPFFAVKVAPAVFHTQGGLAIDECARVIDESGIAVRQLYAAGGAACGVSGSSVSGYLSGNGLLTAVGLGLIAADSVIHQIQEASK